jgi:hypothetical protein
MQIKVTLTVPDSILDEQAVFTAIAAKQRVKTAYDVKRLFRQTTAGWHKPPIWGQTHKFTRSEISVEIYASGANADQYALVNAGAPRHTIHPINPTGWLRFQRGYNASTRPRVLSSRAFSRFGPYSAAKIVHHPGFAAREFDQEIAEQYEDTFRDDMQDAINSAVP